MNSHGRSLAIVAGLAFLSGGLTILLGPVLLTPALWGQYHVLTILMIGGTIAAGHLTKTAWKARFYLSCFGFLVLFLAGTALVVYNSVGRQAEVSETTALSAEHTNRIITDKQNAIDDARDRLADANANVAREMRGERCGPRCKDWKTRASEIDSHIRLLEAELRQLGPQKPVNVKADKMATVAALFGFDKAKASAVFALLEPFLWTLFFEIGSIVSLGFAFRPFPVSTVSSGNIGGGGKVETPKIRLVHTPAEDHEIVALKKALQGRGNLTNDELAAVMGTTKGEASKRVARAQSLGVVSKHRTGRHVAISLHAH